MGVALVLGALPVALLAFVALTGLGLRRELPTAFAVAVAAGLLLLGSLGAARLLGGRLPAFGVSLAAASVTVLALLPLYVPGERDAGLERGLRHLGASDGLVESSRGWLALFGPERAPPLDSRPEPWPLADWVAAMPPASPPDPAPRPEAPAPSNPRSGSDVDEVLPLRRVGERLLVTAHLESRHGADDRDFILDTGAAITTLTRRAAEAVELEFSSESPAIVLNGVGGRSDALLAVVERLWLGNQAVGPLTVAVCESCLPGRGDGLLGIDVLGHFSTEIDADALRLALRRSSGSPPRDLVAPFLKVEARLRIRPHGEVRGEIHVRSVAPADVADVRLTLECPGESFEFGVDHLPPYGDERIEFALPRGTPCPEFRPYVASAYWD